MSQHSAGARFRQAVKESNPLAAAGQINRLETALGGQSRKISINATDDGKRNPLFLCTTFAPYRLEIAFVDHFHRNCLDPTKPRSAV